MLRSVFSVSPIPPKPLFGSPKTSSYLQFLCAHDYLFLVPLFPRSWCVPRRGKCRGKMLYEKNSRGRNTAPIPFAFSVFCPKYRQVLQVVLGQSRAFGCSIPCLRAYVHLRWAKLVYDVRSTTLELDSIRVSFCLRFGSVYALVPKSQVEEGRTICRADDWTFPRFGECRKTSFERKPSETFRFQNKSLYSLNKCSIQTKGNELDLSLRWLDWLKLRL